MNNIYQRINPQKIFKKHKTSNLTLALQHSIKWCYFIYKYDNIYSSSN